MNVLRTLLWPLGMLYGMVNALRNLCYEWGWMRVHRVGVPVISIGNITVGGTGKTPMAEFLLGKLLEMGLKPGYLSRGYGRSSKGFVWVEPGQGDSVLYGDGHCRSRVGSGIGEWRCARTRLQGRSASFPSRALMYWCWTMRFSTGEIARDLDVVMVDATQEPWRDLPLPAGRLREFSRGLRRCHALVVSRRRMGAQSREAVEVLRQQWPDKVVCRAQLPSQGHPCI
ncbi:MAG: tetraacyldisaccharide 4'-kinase [Bacteroidia bacterium]